MFERIRPQETDFENSRPNPVDGYGQETIALVLLRATARGTRALGSLCPQVLKKMAEAMMGRFNNDFFMIVVADSIYLLRRKALTAFSIASCAFLVVDITNRW